MPLSDKVVIPPDAYTKDQGLRSQILNDFNCIKVGIIQDFDPTARTVSVQIATKKIAANGTVLSYPQLDNVPMFTLQGGGKGFIAPVTQGDECIVLFNDQSLDDWFVEGGSQLPNSIRVHDLSDGIALVGLNSQANAVLFNLLTGEVGFSDGEAKVAINGGLVDISNGGQNLLTILTGITTALQTLNGAVSSMTTATIAAGTTQAIATAQIGTITTLLIDLAALLY